MEYLGDATPADYYKYKRDILQFLFLMVWKLLLLTMEDDQKREKYAQFKHFQFEELKILVEQIGDTLTIPALCIPILYMPELKHINLSLTIIKVFHKSSEVFKVRAC